MSVLLADGRTISVPLEWYPRLHRATPAQRANWRLIGEGRGDVDDVTPRDTERLRPGQARTLLLRRTSAFSAVPRMGWPLAFSRASCGKGARK